MRIKIRTNTSPKIKELSDITLVNQIGYAKRNGYDWESYHLDYSRYNEVAIDDLHGLRAAIQSVDVLMWVGADVMFTNWAIKIEDILKEGDSVVVARERGGWWPINNDVMIYVNNEKTINYIDRMIADFDIWKQHIWRQQQHLWNLIIEDETIRNTVRIVDSQVMNQSMKNWQLGEYIVHFYGLPIKEKIENARSVAALFPDGVPVFKQDNKDIVPHTAD
tara:strand:- start:122 stop:781 length:660 start_codon:yes stop_codon:yes gene_type:complete